MERFSIESNDLYDVEPDSNGDWVSFDDAQDAVRAAVAAERERCARVCDDEARLRTEAAQQHAEESESSGRCMAAARAAINCAKGIRSGETA